VSAVATVGIAITAIETLLDRYRALLHGDLGVVGIAVVAVATVGAATEYLVKKSKVTDMQPCEARDPWQRAGF
ncbi:MAG: hypothetical protein ABIR63_02180, partial [Sphingomicrobium sp.]